MFIVHRPQSCLIALIAGVVAACQSEYELKDLEEDPETYDLWEWECPPSMDFQTTFLVDANALQDCLGTDAYGFVYDLPGYLQFRDEDACWSSTSGTCMLLGPVVSDPLVDDRCNACLPWDDLHDANPNGDCCNYGSDSTLESLLLLAELSDWCDEEMGVSGLSLTSSYVTREENLLADEAVCGEAPVTTDYATTYFGPNAYLLEIDPDTSSMTYDDGESSTTTAVRGTLVIASNPARVVTGALWVDDPAVPNGFSSWTFGVHAPVALDANSGSFTMGPSSTGLFFGTGTIDNAEYVARIGMKNTASGTLNLTSGVWSASYLEVGTTYQVGLSLGGEVVPWE